MCGFTYYNPRGLLRPPRPPTWRGNRREVRFGGSNGYNGVFCRLDVVGGEAGAQPFRWCTGGAGGVVHQMTNGEIYNHRQLRSQLRDAVRGGAPPAPRPCLAECGIAASRVRDSAYAALKHEFSEAFEVGALDGPDCDIISKLVLYYGVERAFSMLHGEFAVLIEAGPLVILARDHYGVRPLFFGHSIADGSLVVASEARCLPRECAHLVPDFRQFPPGHFLVFNTQTGAQSITRFTPFLRTPAASAQTPVTGSVVDRFDEAVRVRVEQRQPGEKLIVLLSGGFDSSMVLRSVMKFVPPEEVIAASVQVVSAAPNTAAPDTAAPDTAAPDTAAPDTAAPDTAAPREDTAAPREDTDDIKYARRLCEAYGIQHFVVDYDISDPETVLEDVGRAIETIQSYDVTTVRASTPQLVMMRAVSAKFPLVKIVLSGEGADELAQGYLEFLSAPDPAAADAHSRERLADVHLFDGLRADRTVASVAMELRLPFLDTAFAAAFLGIPAAQRFNGVGSGRTEKAFLRRQFAASLAADEKPGGARAVVSEIVHRRKEAFSDSVGSEWVACLKDVATTQRPPELLSPRHQHLPSPTREADLYRYLFEISGPGQALQIPYRWMPNWNDVDDPSARVLDAYGKIPDQTRGPEKI